MFCLAILSVRWLSSNVKARSRKSGSPMKIPGSLARSPLLTCIATMLSLLRDSELVQGGN
ncbi:hypothetical protein Poly41_39460 [Novipirellula artificiosorum]|uniref:Uncharacterized protein n=1 Tax=Novipirellula artificiosorum TaxID=2528016 RepID=A0A5C6DI12_9BACT|nr:hypothetical protein Poly41_39460 [Novipirellula artificiosorum]